MISQQHLSLKQIYLQNDFWLNMNATSCQLHMLGKSYYVGPTPQT